MERFQPGDVVFAQFIFTDASQTKNRPAVIIAALQEDNYLMCSVTSQASPTDPFRIELKKDDLIDGSLPRDSFIRPNLLMTVHRTLILWKQGTLPAGTLEQVRHIKVDIVTGSAT